MAPTFKLTPSVKVFKCTCNASARFIPLYRFNESGEMPSILPSGTLHPAAMRCGNCGQMYVWDAATGGWRRESLLDDLLTLEANGG